MHNSKFCGNESIYELSKQNSNNYVLQSQYQIRHMRIELYQDQPAQTPKAAQATAIHGIVVRKA